MRDTEFVDRSALFVGELGHLSTLPPAAKAEGDTFSKVSEVPSTQPGL